MATCRLFSAILFTLLQLSSVYSDCHQNSFLWKVNATPPVYLFGTVHLPYDTLWDAIPSNVKTAFSMSRDVFLELQLSDEETSDGLQECQLLSNNKTIDRVLSPELVTRIEQYLEKIRKLLPGWIDEDPMSNFFLGGGSYSDHLFSAVTHNWKRKKPIWVLSLISSLTEENIRLRRKPVLDRFLDNAARSLGKNLAALETVNDHCQPLNRLENDQVETVLRIQLDYLESLPSGPPSTLSRDIDAYKCGDLAALINSEPMLPLPPLINSTNITNITSDEMAVIEEVETLLYNRLVTRRNRRMTKTIDALLKTERTDPVFIAIGAGHLVATKSIIDRLSRKGYTVQHLDASEVIEGPSLPPNIVALGDPGSTSQTVILDIPDENPVQHSRLEDLTLEDLESLFREYNFGGERRKRALHILRRLSNRGGNSDSDSGLHSSSRTTATHHTLLLSALVSLALLICSRLH